MSQTAEEVKALIDLIRAGDAAESALDPSTLSTVKAGVAARARLGASMRADMIYSTDPVPRTVWMLDPESGLALEIQPQAFPTSPAVKGR